MNYPFFSGVCTALITPFFKGEVNHPMLEQLLKRQWDAGIRAIVVCGTTGEAATLSDAEKLEIVQTSKDKSPDNCKIIAGTGTNDTKHAVELSVAAQNAGADALLVVSPYYNKATSEGLIAHYTAIAGAVHIPVIIYNVPSRTGTDMSPEVYQALAQIPNIVGVKEASKDISKIARIRLLCPEHFAVWSGNDDMIVPTLALGGSGVISVLSNISPTLTCAMTNAALDGDFDTASDLQIRLLPLIESLFCEVNPIPVKAAMKLLGFDCGDCRLPLTKLTQGNHENLKKQLSFL